jgi:hypothetical protein
MLIHAALSLFPDCRLLVMALAKVGVPYIMQLRATSSRLAPTMRRRVYSTIGATQCYSYQTASSTVAPPNPVEKELVFPSTQTTRFEETCARPPMLSNLTACTSGALKFGACWRDGIVLQP